MNNKLILSIAISGLILSGCTTQSIQKGKDLSTSGIAYADAVDNLLVVTTDQVIDFDSAELRKSRRGSNPEAMVATKNESLIDILMELNRFRSQTKLLKTYFINLQALSDSTVKDDTGGAVKSLSDSINKLNKAIELKNRKESLSEDQQKQVSKLGGLVANTIHAAKVEKSLKRDAEIIGTYLALQQNQLSNITEILKDRFQAENDLFLSERIVAPFIDNSKPLPSSWSNDRKKWIKSQFVNQQLKTAEEAAKQLRGIWVDILKGKSDIDSLSILISDVNRFVTTVKSLEDANKTSSKTN